MGGGLLVEGLSYFLFVVWAFLLCLFLWCVVEGVWFWFDLVGVFGCGWECDGVGLGVVRLCFLVVVLVFVLFLWLICLCGLFRWGLFVCLGCLGWA